MAFAQRDDGDAGGNKGEKTIQTNQAHQQAERDKRSFQSAGSHEALGIFGDTPEKDAQQGAERREKRILDRGDCQYAVKREEGEAGGENQRRQTGHAPLHKTADRRVCRGKAENLEDAVCRRACGHRAEKRIAEAVKPAQKHGMKDRMLDLVNTGQILRNFKFKVVIENAREFGEQNQRVASREQKKEKEERETAVLRAFRFKAQREGKQRAQIR